MPTFTDVSRSEGSMPCRHPRTTFSRNSAFLPHSLLFLPELLSQPVPHNLSPPLTPFLLAALTRLIFSRRQTQNPPQNGSSSPDTALLLPPNGSWTSRDCVSASCAVVITSGGSARCPDPLELLGF